MNNTTYADVVPYFYSLFKSMFVLDEDLVEQWFLQAVDYFEFEIHPLNYNRSTKEFDTKLSGMICSTLGQIMEYLYQDWNLSRLTNLNGIHSKDLSITGTDASKRVAKAVVEDKDTRIQRLLYKFKTNSYSG